jgi:beta-lactamase regulating signal transducer with metallopeptidase domain
MEQAKNYLSVFESQVNNHAALVVGIWFVVLCIQCLRLSISLGYTYRIRHYKIYTPPTGWQALCTNLKNGLGIQRNVSLLESGIIKVPLVVGFFKPLILLPVGLLANLPYSQVESILLHELAHIRRSDYLVNLLQTLVETVFFFNPAILWICALIKEEREACCDAVAVDHLDSKSQYIQALVSFQEYTANSPAMQWRFRRERSPAATGKAHY